MSEHYISWVKDFKELYKFIVSRVASTLDNDKYQFTKNKDHSKQLSLGPNNLNFMFYKNIFTVV